MDFTKNKINELLSNIIIAKVIELKKHEDADRLQIVMLDGGNSESLDKYRNAEGSLIQVVTAANNFAVGDFVAYLPPANIVPGWLITEGQEIKLESRKMRGEISHGMILAEDEIGIGEDHEGIMVLNSRTENSSSVIGESIVSFLTEDELKVIYKKAGIVEISAEDNRLVSKENIYAFIDSQNLNLGILSQGWKLDFMKFRKYLKDKYKVSKAFLFIGYIESNKKMYKALSDYGYELIFKEAVQYTSKKGYEIKGNVDAELVLHSAAIEYMNYDEAVVVSGDGDFKCLYEFLEDKRKLYKVIIPNPKKYSKLLVKFKKYMVIIKRQREKLEYKK